MNAPRLFTSFLSLLLLGLPLLHAQNPYERLGVQSDPLTLSQGRYQEFFPNDTLVQMGSAIFNTITQKVVGFVEPDSSGLDFPADVASRWLSPDPMAAKYPEMSPYVGIGNNPVIFIDPDGREIDDYFDRYGNFLGKDQASTDNIRILTNHGNTMPQGFRNADGSVNREVAIGKGSAQLITEVSFSNAGGLGHDALSKVATHYYEEVGFDASVLSEEKITVKETTENSRNTNMSISLSGNTKNFNIYIDGYGKINGEFYANKFNLMNDIVHEKSHFDNHYKSENGRFIRLGTGFRDQDGSYRHSEAYIEQINHPTWKRTSGPFKEEIIRMTGLHIGNIPSDSKRQQRIREYNDALRKN